MREVEDFAEAMEELARADSSVEVRAIATRMVRAQLQADGATFVFRDGDFCHYVEEDAIQPLWRGQRFPVETCVSGIAMTSRKTVVIGDTADDERVPSDLYEPTFVRSLLLSPIGQRDPVGAVGAYWAQPRVFSDREPRLLKAIASAVALALENLQNLEAIRASEGRLRAVFDNTLQAFVVFDRALLVIDANAVAHSYSRQLYGADLTPGTDVRRLFGSLGQANRFEEHARAAFAGATLAHVSETLVAGRRMWFEVCYTPVRSAGGSIDAVTLSSLDVTEMRNTQEQLVRAQRVEAIGRLTQGIAHDFNNVLTPIMCAADLLRRGDDLESHCNSIESAARHAAELTRQLLAFSRSQVLDVAPADINHEIEQTVRLLSRTLPESIEIATALAPDLPRVLADSTQIAQVLMNLVINAAEAMRDRGGRIDITSKVDDERASAVRLEVVDDGPGMTPEIAERIFDPFFTTKATVGGTGLGLATCQGIVEQHGGELAVDTEPGRGARFTVTLPVGTPPEKPRPRRFVQARHRTDSGTILVVDDDERVREAIGQALTSHGFAVMVAAGMEDAIEAARIAAPDLLITDVMLRDADGPTVRRELESLHPGLPTLYVSGYSADAIADHGVLKQDVHFMAKPFTSDELVAAVRRVLDGGPAGRIDPGG